MAQNDKEKPLQNGRIGGTNSTGLDLNILKNTANRIKQAGQATSGLIGGENTVASAAAKLGISAAAYGLISNALGKKKENEKQTVQSGGGTTKNPYTAQAQALYEQMMNRGDFQYDMQGDMLYRQYADQYSQLGQQAMRDTMGTAAGLTGGYGNSYANTVGNQAYQQYMNQMNSMIPQLYDRAYQQWQDEEADLLTRYQLALEKANAAGRSSGRSERTEEEPGLWDRIAAGVSNVLSNAGNVTQYEQEAKEPISFENYFSEWLKKNRGE